VAVVPIPDDLIGNRINAYVVTIPGSRVTSQDLEEHCRRIAPRYMIPDAIEIVPHLPRTSTGKLDRRALVPS